MVKITFLIVEEAETFTVSAPLSLIVDIMKTNLKAGIVVTDIDEDEDGKMGQNLHETAPKTTGKLTNVSCDYTGGGVWVYSALFNNEVWLYGSLEWYLGSYSIPGQEIEDKHDSDYDTFWKFPSVPYPTWGEILASLRETYRDDPNLFYMERQLCTENPNLSERCIDAEGLKDALNEE